MNNDLELNLVFLTTPQDWNKIPVVEYLWTQPQIKLLACCWAEMEIKKGEIGSHMEVEFHVIRLTWSEAHDLFIKDRKENEAV